jgi:hypothetical protein
MKKLASHWPVYLPPHFHEQTTLIIFVERSIEMSFLRRMLRIKWTDKVTNEDFKKNELTQKFDQENKKKSIIFWPCFEKTAFHKMKSIMCNKSLSLDL